MAATALGNLYFAGLEDPAVGCGWLSRAVRLLEREAPCVEYGYAVIGLMGASVASAEELDASAGVALDLARRFHDPNLECKALGDSALTLVSMGRVREGMQRLDEAFHDDHGELHLQDGTRSRESRRGVRNQLRPQDARR